MKTSPNDPRQYHSLILDNGLRVVIVENKETERAAASMVVNAGHFDDPDDTQGLAHFLEHMLFLGTKSYPDSGEYQSFISQHNGSNNAWTGTEHTCFYFDIEQPFFYQALTRFSRFFSEPLLKAEHINSERNNVDAEFQMKLKEDTRRIYDVQKETVNPLHPFSKFSVGNLETLNDAPGRSLRQVLQDFFDNYYCAPRMTLAIESSLAVSEVQQQVSKEFNQIKSGPKEKPAIIQPLYLPENLAIQLAIPPQTSQRKLVITFALPGLDTYYQYKPVSYLSYLLGHEGPGSILSLLKKRQWAMSLTSGGGVNGSNFKDFNISISLTEKGEQHQTEIIDLLFSYLRMLTEDGIQELYFNEKRALTEFAFNYKENSKPLENVNQLAINMQHYPEQDYIYGDYKIKAFKPDLLRKFLAYFTAENMRVMEIRKSVNTDRVSRWYQTPYQMQQIPPLKLQRWQQAEVYHELTLPKANPFIVEKPTIYSGESTATPEKVRQRTGFNFWFKQDKTFRSPKGQVFVSLESPYTIASVKQIAMTRLFVELFSESVQEQNYQAELAGIHYQVYSHQGGITIQISGISEKQPLLLDNLLHAVCDHSLPLERFQLFKKQLISNWRDVTKGKPVSQLFSLLNALFKPYSPHALELADAMQDAGFDEFREFCSILFSQLSVEAFAYGNWPKKEAINMADKIQNHLGGAMKATALVHPEIIDFNSAAPARFVIDIAEDENACVVYFPMPSNDFQSKALAILTSQMIAPMFFHQLRTVRQLGYLVGVNYMPMNRFPGIAFFVQSPNISAEILAEEIFAFLQRFSTHTEMENWDKIQQGIINQLDAKDTSPRIRSQRFWHSITNHDYEFNNRSILKKEVSQLHKQQVIDFIDNQLTSDKGLQPVILTTNKKGTTSAGDSAPAQVFTNIKSFHNHYSLKY
ncbi:insulinase family protein [Thalassotalea sp. PS06]|uniref:insulinase family protein n=1 Tax=Thalassotalea sp. PS06 TaxID=2594005 RepID=UPI00163D5EE4|nr:insulinase family protein [Thalassotalea sp. PS06]